jgi:DNA invertase Pin-like site-specific DNA recombinase
MYNVLADDTRRDGWIMRVGIYARVSTSDKDQNPETQLLPLREFVKAQGWQLVGEPYVDRVSATKLTARTAWKRLLDDASKRRIDMILVWKMDRCFRSVAHAIETVQQLQGWGVGLRSYSESWMDTSGTNAAGKLIFTIFAGFAEFERDLIAERVRAGLDRVRRHGSLSGKPIGRPTVINGEWEAIEPLLVSGQLSQVEAARQLGCSRTSVQRRLGARKGREVAPRQTVKNQAVA